MPQIGDVTAVLRADAAPLVRGFDQATRKTTEFGRAAQGAERLSNRLERALGGAAFAAAGVPGPLGKAASVMLQFGTGGPVALGVIAGLGAIAVAWQMLRAEINMTREAQEKAAEFAGTLGRTPMMDAVLQLSITRTQLSNARKAAETARAGTHGGFKIGGGEIRIVDPAAVKRADDEVVRLTDNLKKLQGEVRKLSGESDKALADLEFNLTGLMVRMSQLPSTQMGNTLQAQFLAGKFLPGFMGDPSLLRRPNLGIRGISKSIDESSSKRFAEIAELTRMQNFLAKQAAAESEDAWQGAGEQLAQALMSGITHTLASGKFTLGSVLKSLALTALNIVLSRGISSMFAAGGAAGTSVGSGAVFGAPAMPEMPLPTPSAGIVLDFSGMPAAPNPVAAARDATWQVFLRESVRSAHQSGFRVS